MFFIQRILQRFLVYSDLVRFSNSIIIWCGGICNAEAILNSVSIVGARKPRSILL